MINKYLEEIINPVHKQVKQHKRNVVLGSWGVAPDINWIFLNRCKTLLGSTQWPSYFQEGEADTQSTDW